MAAGPKSDALEHFRRVVRDELSPITRTLAELAGVPKDLNEFRSTAISSIKALEAQLTMFTAKVAQGVVTTTRRAAGGRAKASDKNSWSTRAARLATAKNIALFVEYISTVPDEADPLAGEWKQQFVTPDHLGLIQGYEEVMAKRDEKVRKNDIEGGHKVIAKALWEKIIKPDKEKTLSAQDFYTKWVNARTMAAAPAPLAREGAVLPMSAVEGSGVAPPMMPAITGIMPGSAPAAAPVAPDMALASLDALVASAIPYCT